MDFKKCPKKFFFSYNDDAYFNYNNKDATSRALIDGQTFHNECDAFFPKLDMDTLVGLNLEGRKIYMRSLLPKTADYTTRPSYMDKWFDFFVQVEANRYGYYNSVDGLKSFKPKAVEWEITQPGSVDFTGHVDRIDYLPEEKSYCVVEYKTGMSYALSKSWVKSQIAAECGFYARIINNEQLLDKPITHYALINPTSKDYHVRPLSSQTMKAVDRVLTDMTKRIKQNGPWERKMSLLCDWCKYREPCFNGGILGETGFKIVKDKDE